MGAGTWSSTLARIAEATGDAAKPRVPQTLGVLVTLVLVVSLCRAANVVRSYLPQGRGNELEVAATSSSGAGPESRLWAGVVQQAQDARTAGPDGEYPARRRIDGRRATSAGCGQESEGWARRRGHDAEDGAGRVLR